VGVTEPELKLSLGEKKKKEREERQRKVREGRELKKSESKVCSQ